MKIEQGLFDNMVLQRTGRNACDARFRGTCENAGEVQARVARKGSKSAGWRKVGRAARGSFEGRLTGLPAGGPYDIELRVVDRGAAVDLLKIRNVLVGDVWVLGGQSNMEGIGYLSHRLKPMPKVRAFYMTDEWDVAEDPIHTLWCAVDPVHNGNPKVPRKPAPSHVGVGPGVGFGQEMFRRTGIPQGLIACGHGGTSMSQWDPALKDQGGKSLYGASLRRVRKNGGRVAGIVWYQGCSDANADAAPLYTKRMAKLVRSMRRDFGGTQLPFAMVQISRVIGWGPGGEVWWNSIQEQERRLPDRVPNLTVVPAIDLALDDGIHISGFGQNRLGVRLARAMLALLGGRKAGRPPIALKKIRIENNPFTNLANVIVEFASVAGRLRAGGRPSGFTVGEKAGSTVVYRTDLDGNKAILRTGVAVSNLGAYSVWYGQGTDPYCNVTDEADRAVPVFGPLPLSGRPRALSDYVRRLRTSKLLPTTDMDRLVCPKDLSPFGMEMREFAGNFCDRHLELGPAGACLIYFACRFRCMEPMKLRIHFGYDGPVKVWIDGKKVLYDPEGINPANPDDAIIPMRASAGEHEMLAALDSNGGRAWGVFVRFERLDVSRKQIVQGPGAYAMPEVLG